LGRGCDNREIARRLGISVKTVKTHTGRIYDKLMVSDRTEAVVVAAGLGLIALGRQAD
jgi:DNA-binding NarL/FixJ family response regulator